MSRPAQVSHGSHVSGGVQMRRPAQVSHGSHMSGGGADEPASPGEPREPRERGGSEEPASPQVSHGSHGNGGSEETSSPGEPREPRERGSGERSVPASAWPPGLPDEAEVKISTAGSRGNATAGAAPRTWRSRRSTRASGVAQVRVLGDFR